MFVVSSYARNGLGVNKQEALGRLRSPELKWASKSASATLTLLHSEFTLSTFKVLFFSI